MAKSKWLDKYSKENIIITLVLLGKIDVTLIPPDKECFRWRTEEEVISANRRTGRNKNSWAIVNDGRVFCFKRKDGREFNAVFDRIFGFLSPEEYKSLMSQRKRRRGIDLHPTVLFSQLTEVSSFVGLLENHVDSVNVIPAERETISQIPPIFGFLTEEQYRSLEQARLPQSLPESTFPELPVIKDVANPLSDISGAIKKIRKGVVKKRFDENVFSTMMLGNIAGVSLYLPHEHSPYWHSRENANWPKDNNGKTFYFVTGDGRQIPAVFDKTLGFLTVQEYDSLQQQRSSKLPISLKSTLLLGELSSITGVANGKSEAIPPSFPLPGDLVHPEKTSFLIPQGFASSSSTLFGGKLAIPVEESPSWVSALEINSSPF